MNIPQALAQIVEGNDLSQMMRQPLFCKLCPARRLRGRSVRSLPRFA